MAFDEKTHEILIKALGIGSLTQDEQEKKIAHTGALIYQAVLVKALGEMSEEKVGQFEKLVETKPEPEEIFTFFRSNIKDFDNMIEKEAEDFIKDGQDIMSQIG